MTNLADTFTTRRQPNTDLLDSISWTRLSDHRNWTLNKWQSTTTKRRSWLCNMKTMLIDVISRFQGILFFSISGWSPKEIRTASHWNQNSKEAYCVKIIRKITFNSAVSSRVFVCACCFSSAFILLLTNLFKSFLLLTFKSVLDNTFS